MSETFKELKKLQAEMQTLLSPFEKQERELRNKLEQEEIGEQQRVFKLIEGKLFYGDKNTWNGYSDCLILIKPIDCSDWSPYNSCNVVEFKIRLEKGKFSSLSISETQSRVDLFKTHYKELTAELFEQVKEFANNGLEQSLNHFLCVGEK